MGKVVIVTVKVPREVVEEIDRLVLEGKFSSRSELIRRALAFIITRYSTAIEST